MTAVLGLRVMRGPHWKDGDQDGGEGHLGTMTQLLSSQRVRVQWDNGNDNIYNAGADGKLDLRIFDSAQAGVRHPGTVCAECGEKNIYGMLWRCQDCASLDLCSLCYGSDKHEIRHTFLRLDHFQSQGQPVKKRKVSVRMRSMGAFPGAKVVRSQDWMWGDQDGGPGSQGEIKAFENVAPDSSRNLIRVEWLSKGVANSYRLGYQGHVDIRCTEEEVGPFYYRDHLPLLDTNDLPYPLAPQEAFSTDKMPQNQHQQQEQPLIDTTAGIVAGETGSAEPIDNPDEATMAIVPKTSTGTPPSPEDLTGRSTSRPPGENQQTDVHTGTSGGKRETVDENQYESSFAVGDHVTIGVNENTLRELQEDYGGVSERMVTIIGNQEGMVTATTPNILVTFSPTQYKLNPLALVKVAELKVGDVVRIRSDIHKVKLLNKKNIWSQQIAETCGMVGRVDSVNAGDHSVSVKFGHYQTYRYSPACCLPAPSAAPDPVGALGAARRAKVTGDADGPDQRATAAGAGHGSPAPGRPRVPVKAAQPAARSAARPAGTVAVSPPAAWSGGGMLPVTRNDEPNAGGNQEDDDANIGIQNAVMKMMGLMSKSGSDDYDDVDPHLKVLFGAIAAGATSAVETLLRTNKSLMTKTIQGLNALMYASLKGEKDIVELLLTMGSDINARTDKGKSSLLIALDSKEEETALLLLQRGADPRVVNAKQRTALHEAAYENLPNALQMLLTLGADVNAKDFVGDTPLFDAIQLGHQQIVEILLQAPALNVNELNVRGFNMLMFAALRGHGGCLETILNSARHPYVDDLLVGEYSALQIAANNDHVECIGLLVLVGGATIDLGDGRRSLTALHLTCKRRQFKSAEALIQLGANVNAVDKNGNTALHLAMGKSLEGDRDDEDVSHATAVENRTQLACFLITSGAVVDSTDDYGKTPLSYGYPEVQENVRQFLKEKETSHGNT